MKTRRVAIVGGNRIPFARSNGPYAHASDQDMLTATLDGLVERFSLEGERLGEVVAGAVLKHARDRDLTREAVLGSKLAPETPAYDVQQACGTGLETTIAVANKIALGQIDAGIAGGVDTASDAPIAVNEDLRQILLDINRAKSLPARARNLDAAAAGPGRARTAAQRRAAHRAVDGRARGADGARLGRHARGAGRARPSRRTRAWPRRTSAASTTTSCRPTWGWSATRTCAPDTSTDKLAKLKPVFGGEDGTMTAGNSTPLSDGASAVLLASEEWAAERGLPVLAYFVDAQTAAVDHVHKGEGLLMAPAYAMPRLLDRNELGFADFDLFEIHEAFASQVLATLARLARPGVQPRAARPRGAAGRDRPRPSSTSTAARWPPGTRSPPPAGGSWPRSRRRSTSAAAGAA